MIRTIGLDIGGSGTGFTVMDETGRVYMRGVWPETRWDCLATIVQRVSGLGNFHLVGIGAAGVWTRKERLRLEAGFSGCGQRVLVFSDAEVALTGAFAGQNGVVIIAGTGSMALAKTSKGLLRMGGYGHLIGDPGGGFWLARMGIDAALRARDGLGPETSLAEMVPPDPRNFVLSLNHTKLAALAPRVLFHASSGDPVALSVVKQGLEYLADMAQRLMKRAGEQLPVSYQGGLFGSTFYLRGFRTELEKRGITLISPRHPGSWGAAFLALSSR